MCPVLEEPMDSLCEEAGLKRFAKACPTQVEVAAVPEPQPEGVVAASAPAAPEKSGQGGPPTVQDGPPTVQDAGLPSSTHKPGKITSMTYGYDLKSTSA